MPLERIEIFNRVDCCASRLKDVHVFVSDTPFGSQTLDEILARTDVEHSFFSGVQGQQLEMPLDISGRYIRVHLQGSGVLSLAEVRVMGVAQ